jgi:hypothetical protein
LLCKALSLTNFDDATSSLTDPRIQGSQQAHFSLDNPRPRVERAPVYISNYFDYIYDYFDYVYDYFLVTTLTTP